MEAIDVILSLTLCGAAIYYLCYQIREDLSERREASRKAARERMLRRELEFMKDYAIFFSEVHSNNCGQQEVRTHDTV